jgi:hypothetical protein
VTTKSCQPTDTCPRVDIRSRGRSRFLTMVWNIVRLIRGDGRPGKDRPITRLFFKQSDDMAPKDPLAIVLNLEQDPYSEQTRSRL